jgi:hypothetical protein
MVRRFLAGLLLVMGGAAIAVGVSPAWVTPAGSGQALNGFTLGSTPVDAVVSFVLGGVLMLVGLVIALRGGAISRALGMLTSLLAVVWAAEILFLLSAFKHDVDHLAPAVSLARDLNVGYFLVAGGALVAFLGGLVSATVPSRRSMRSQAVPARTPASAVRTLAPAGTNAATPPAWNTTGTAGAPGTPRPRDTRTTVEAGSGQ